MKKGGRHGRFVLLSNEALVATFLDLLGCPVASDLGVWDHSDHDGPLSPCQSASAQEPTTSTKHPASVLSDHSDAPPHAASVS